MTITLTHPTKNQWGKVGKVVLWLLVSAVCAVATAYVANNPKWLATLPGWNILGVLIQQVLTQEEDNALANVPADVKAEVAKVAPQVVTPSVVAAPSAPQFTGNKPQM